MAQHNDLGRLGEDAAVQYLLERHYHILARNWRAHPLEVDIIAEEYGEVVFIEVKTRSDDFFADPESAVDHYKQENLSLAALSYLRQKQLRERPFRFDIITLVGEESPFKIKHFVNAFPLRRPSQHNSRGLENIFF